MEKEKKHNCLNCKYEPNWLEFRESRYGFMKTTGKCNWFKYQKLPARFDPNVEMITIARYKDGSGLPEVCDAWVQKKENCKKMELIGKELTKKRAIELVLEELERANKKFPNFNSKHEGCAVIKEEFDEIKKKNYNISAIQSECIQVAAMCIKFLTSSIYD